MFEFEPRQEYASYDVWSGVNALRVHPDHILAGVVSIMSKNIIIWLVGA